MSSPFTRLSRSAEDYLEAIGHLCRENGRAQVSDVAAMLNVKKPSVTAAVHQLAEEGLITYRRYAPIELTEKGRQYADHVIRAHDTLQRFLAEAAGLTQERADEIACQMEHILTMEEIEQIEQRLD
ncbi:MAG: metal-dependent transcriptional regulator [Akkermansia sp.]|nr:metal-dependent transcriptional regulator [Akkermansia sp.]